MIEEAARGIRLAEEVRLAVDLLQVGLGHLQRIDGANDQYHVPILLLASGFERLIKCLLCLRVLHDEGRYPTPGEIRQTHNLRPLLQELTDALYVDDFVARPAIRDDLTYLRSDEQLLSLVTALSDFGQAARYYNLDVVSGKDPQYPSPEEAWNEIENAIIERDPAWARKLEDRPAAIDDLFERVNRELVIGLERLARALARLFTLSRIAEEARVFTGLIGPFLFLRDDELGRTMY
jgi:hypothetical protein